MALQKEQWISDIEKNLYADNQFMTIGKNDSAYVRYKTVHLPQAGARNSVKKDRAVLPATVSQRTDSELTYNLGSYTIDPRLINQNDDVQYLSYDKRMSVMGDGIKDLGDTVAEHTLYAWAASVLAQQVLTTGAASNGSLAHSTATGTRLLVTLADLVKARGILDRQNLGNGRVVMIVPANMYWNDLLQISQITKSLEYGRAVLPSGVIGSVLGMDIMIRSSVSAYDNTATRVRKVLNEDGTIASKATSDTNSIMLVHEKYVRKALGEVHVYETLDSPIYYGDIISAEVFHGASKSRTNGEGIVNIIQAT